MSSSFIQYLYSITRLLFVIQSFSPSLLWLIGPHSYPHEPSPVQILACQQAGERQTWPLFIVSLCCYVDILRSQQTSPLEGFANLLPPSRGFAALGPRLAGRLWPLTARHVETCLAWGRRERGRSSTRWLVMGRTWGEEAPVGSHVIRRSSLEDAIEEVLQICRVGRTCGVLRGRPEREGRKVQRCFVLDIFLFHILEEETMADVLDMSVYG